MASCKDCRDYDFCKAGNPREGVYLEIVNDVETKCEDFVPKEIWTKLSEEKKSNAKATEAEETTLKIKASAYDAIKEAMTEQMKMDYSISDTFNIIDGVIRMEEAVTAAFIK